MWGVPEKGPDMSEEIKLAPIHKLMKKAGARRVSKEGAEALAFALEEIGLRIDSEAVRCAGLVGRRTVKARDIQFAAEKILEDGAKSFNVS
jgi:histone H3/H4